MIESRTTRRFWRLFSNLPADVQLEAKRAFRLFQADPTHPSLRFKKLEGEDATYSARVGLNYRALAVVKRGHAVWFWIGSHSEYDRLV